MRIGIIGAGMIGSTLAKLWVDAGHDVRVASRHPDELKSMIERLGTRASAGTPQDAAMFGDVVVLTVPLKAVPDLARDLAAALDPAVALVRDAGFDPVVVGPLARGKEFEPHEAIQHRNERTGASHAVQPPDGARLASRTRCARHRRTIRAGVTIVDASRAAALRLPPETST